MDEIEKEAFDNWWNIASTQYPIKDPKTLAFEAWLESIRLFMLKENKQV